MTDANPNTYLFRDNGKYFRFLVKSTKFPQKQFIECTTVLFHNEFMRDMEEHLQPCSKVLSHQSLVGPKLILVTIWHSCSRNCYYNCLAETIVLRIYVTYLFY